MQKDIKGYLLGDNEISVIYYIDEKNPQIINVVNKGCKSVDKYEYVNTTDTLQDAVMEDLNWYKSEGYDVNIIQTFLEYNEIEKIMQIWDRV